jgi:hypothetical protein
MYQKKLPSGAYFLLYFLDMSVLKASYPIIYHGEEVLAEEYYDIYY